MLLMLSMSPRERMCLVGNNRLRPLLSFLVLTVYMSSAYSTRLLGVTSHLPELFQRLELDTYHHETSSWALSRGCCSTRQWCLLERSQHCIELFNALSWGSRELRTKYRIHGRCRKRHPKGVHAGQTTY